MDILFIEDNLAEKEKIIPLLKKQLTEEITLVSSIQEGIEFLENPESQVKLLICDYHGAGSVLIKCLLSIRPDVPCLIITDAKSAIENIFKKKPSALIEIVNRATILEDLPKSIIRIQKRTPLELLKVLDSEFIRMNINFFRLLKPLGTNVYIRLSENKYLKIFRKEDDFEEEDLLKYLKKTKGEYFYLRQSEANHILERQNSKLADLMKSGEMTAEQTHSVVGTYLEIMQAVITKSGFTPQVQDLAKKTVSLTLKVLGNSPKLSSILKRMKQEEGKYIPSHSIALAEISCALAFKVDWHSSGTFLKLSLAAFLHDLPLTDDSLAQVQTLTELATWKTLTQSQIQSYKLHPFQAADYAKQFREIPPDVDTIIMEHHERPDGSGFPRGLRYNQITPLASLFIISHDLLNFLLSQGKAANMKDFLEARAERYQQGTFGKIFRTLQQE